LLVSSFGEKKIDGFIPVKNTSDNPTNQFHFDPKNFIPQIYDLENKGVKWIGVIHSHPQTSAFPSLEDISNWHYPELSYWIYSLKDDQLKAYSIKEGKVKAIEYRITL